jgi:hypothetical protein
LKLSAVGGAKVKANVGASHPPTMPHCVVGGNPMSGAEHERPKIKESELYNIHKA